MQNLNFTPPSPQDAPDSAPRQRPLLSAALLAAPLIALATAWLLSGQWGVSLIVSAVALVIALSLLVRLNSHAVQYSVTLQTTHGPQTLTLTQPQTMQLTQARIRSRGGDDSLVICGETQFRASEVTDMQVELLPPLPGGGR